MTQLFAIKRPDGTLIVDTRARDELDPWRAAWVLEKHDGHPLAEAMVAMKRAGYTCVPVSVSEVGQEPVATLTLGDGVSLTLASGMWPKVREMPAGRYSLYLAPIAVSEERQTMSTHLDLDDVAATSPLAREELDRLRAENAGLRSSADELRRAVADLFGADPETWPDHGNAPLAIAASLALAQNSATKLRERVARLEKAIRWALGYDEGEPKFTSLPYGAGAYWWREELRRRAALAQTGETG